jgi:hypothetical protein
MLQLMKKVSLKASKVLAQSSPEATKIYKENELDIVIPKLNKQEQLDFLTDYYAHLPKQGSAEWLKLRLGGDDIPPNVGGSEIAALLGNDMYKSMLDFYRTKLGLSHFDGNIFTRWGICFENVVTFIIEKMFRTQVKEFGALHGIKHQGHVLQCYSPDGLFITDSKNIINMKQYITNYDLTCNKNDQNVVLVEIKSPFSRMPNKTIPKQYKDQVQLGLNTIKFADFALFFDAAFRKCGIDQLHFNDSFDSLFQRSRRGLTTTPFAIGYMIFYEEGNTKAVIDDILKLKRNMPKTKEELVEQTKHMGWYAPYARHALARTVGWEMNWYSEMTLPEFPEFNFGRDDKFKFDCQFRDDIGYQCNIKDSLVDGILDCLKSKQNIKAILPWKLFNFDIVAEKYDPTFLDLHREKIIEVMMDIFEIKKMKLPNDELDAFLVKKFS